MESKIVVGIDIGGTNTAIGLVDENGECLSQANLPTKDFDEPSGFVEAVAKEVRALFAPMQDDFELCGVGIGAPNGNFYSGMIEEAPNLAWKGKVPMAEMLGKALDLPSVLTNDANAAAFGEQLYGGARGMRNFCVVTIGTGLGSGLVVKDHLIYGHSGFAGELGHTNVYPDGRHCTCGRTGCLEAYVSARGIKETVIELLNARETESRLRDISYDDLDARVIASAAEAGDEIAIETFEFTGRILGRQLADCVAMTSPEAIFLFGGVARAGDLLLEPTRRSLKAHLLNVFQGSTRIELSGLMGKNAAILGAAAMAWKTHCVKA